MNPTEVITFISSRLAGSVPALRFDKLLFGRIAAAGGRDTTMEAGRLCALLMATVVLLFCPSITGLHRKLGRRWGEAGEGNLLTTWGKQFPLSSSITINKPGHEQCTLGQDKMQQLRLNKSCTCSDRDGKGS